MPRDPSDIDRLIEEGLDRYGAGDVDGALLAWERALQLEPDNAQALSYVEYVRVNYDLLVTSGEPGLDEEGPPFAINEEPEYEIEILPGELPPGEAAPVYLDPGDSGWMIDEEKTRERPSTAATEPGLTVELEAEEPPGINFEDATKEYERSKRERAASNDFASPESPTAEFKQDETTGGFSSQHTTDVKARKLGFVQPVDQPPPPTPPPDLPKITVRTPQPDKATIGKAQTVDIGQRPDDLVASLPSPRPSASGTSPGGEPALATSPTKEFAGIPTAKVPSPPELDASDEQSRAPTKDLGIKPLAGARRPPTIDDEPTTQSKAQQLRAQAAGTANDLATPFDAIDTKAAQILDDVDHDAPEDETREDRTRRRITDLVERAVAWSGITEIEKAVIAIELAFNEDPNSALAQKLIHRNRDTIMTIYQSYLGDLERQPHLARPLHELGTTPIGPRAAFLLSRIDGMLSLDEILDVSGMPRLEAYRHLSQLFLRGILR